LSQLNLETPGSPNGEQQSDPVKGQRLKWLGIFFIVVGFVLPIVLAILADAQTKNWRTWLGFFVIAGGTKLYLKGRRHLALSMQALLEKDPRPPVLYLRSFGADKYAARIPTGGLLRRFFGISGSIFDLQTEEELVAEVLGKIGPVVCIGKPGEKLPELGAARVYVSHEEWQQTVHDFMTKAKLVVLRLGDTPGFWWEVERSVSTIDPTRLLLMVPFGKRKYRAFAEKAAQYFRHPLPAYSARRNWLGIRYTRSLGTLRGFIYFKEDWTPEYVDIVRVRWPWKMTPRFIGRRRIFQKLTWGLQPVFKQLGVEWNPPKTRPLLMVAAVLASFTGIVFVLGIVCLLGFIFIPQWLHDRNYNNEEAAYLTRLQNAPEMVQAHGTLTTAQARAVGLDLSEKGLLRLSDEELIERESLYLRVLTSSTSSYTCAHIASSGVHSDSFEESLKRVPAAQIQRWFEIQGDAALAEARQTPRVDAVTDKEWPAVYQVLEKPPADNQTPEQAGTLGHYVEFFLLSRNVSDPDAVTLFTKLSGNLDSAPGFHEYQATEEEVCSAMTDLQKAALAVPVPENGRVARAIAMAEK